MVGANGILEHLPTQIAGDTRWIAQAHPGNTWIRTIAGGISLDAKYGAWAKCNGRRRYWLLRATTTDLNLAGGEQYTTNQCSHKKNPEFPFHAVLSTPGLTLPFASFAMPD